MKAKEFSKLIAHVVEEPSAYGLRECTICGRELIHFVGIWIADEKHSKLLNAPPDKRRSVIYALCEECTQGDEEKILDNIQSIILKEFQDGNDRAYEILP